MFEKGRKGVDRLELYIARRGPTKEILPLATFAARENILFQYLGGYYLVIPYVQISTTFSSSSIPRFLHKPDYG